MGDNKIGIEAGEVVEETGETKIGIEAGEVIEKTGETKIGIEAGEVIEKTGKNKIGIEAGDVLEDNKDPKSPKRNELLVKVLGSVVGVLGLTLIGCLAGIIVLGTRHQSLSQLHQGGSQGEFFGPGTAPTRHTPPIDDITECKTQVCEDLAADFRLSMDSQVDPCDDFYQYACGGWINRTEIPSNKPIVLKSFSSVRKLITTNIKEMLEEKVGKSDSEEARKRKTLYRSCMNTSAMENEGLVPLRDLFRSHNVSWPMVLDTEESNIDIMAEAVRYAKMGFPSIIDLMVLEMGRRRLLVVGINPPSRLDGSWAVSAAGHLTTYLNDTMAILRPNTNHTDAINDMMAYQQNMSAFSAAYKGKHWKDTSKFIKLKDFNSTIYDIEGAVKEIMAQKSINITMSGEDEILIGNFKAFIDLLEFLQETNKTTLANVQAFVVLEQVIQYLPNALRKIRDDYQNKLRGIHDTPPRYMTCVEPRTELMPYITTRMYVLKYLTPTFKTKVDEMMDTVIAQMLILLSRTEWMDKPTKARAMRKAAAMTYDNAYSDWILNDNAHLEIYQEYQHFDIKDSATPLENFLGATRANFATNMKLLTNKHQVPQLFTLMTNAFYLPYSNMIRFTTGILHKPFYLEDAPNAVNYGAVGMVAAHEVTHGYDVNGREFDENGNFFDWWTNESRTNFDKGIECMIQQYNNYTIVAINQTVDGRKTVAENIADIGGVNLAYAAYRTWAETEGREEPRLPGLDLSPNQLFFLSFANTFCLKASVEFLGFLNTYDPHTVNEFRIRGSLQGNARFAKAFGCPRGSPMNPGPQCPLW